MKSMSKKLSAALMASLMFGIVGCTGEESVISDSEVEKNEVMENSEEEHEKEISNVEKDSSESFPLPKKQEEKGTQSVPEIKHEETYTPTEKYTPVEESVPEVETIPDVPACDDTIPYGAFTDYSAASQYAQNRLDQLANSDWEHWNQGGYCIDTMANSCGTLYYTVRLYRWEGNTKVFA